MHIGIIGGGFSGCMLAVQLMRQTKGDVAITLIERGTRLCRGLAYGTDNPDHYLNVRANNMSAFPDDPGHLHRWLTQNRPELNIAPTDFVSRMTYGDYVEDTFNRTIADGKVKFSIVTGEAVGLQPGAQPTVSLADGRTLTFDRLALCLGNLPSAPAPGLTDAARSSGFYIHEPWRLHAFEKIAPTDSVMIIGSGLTMADVMLSLSRQGCRQTITVYSRHGLRPHAHKPPKHYEMQKPSGSLLEMLRTIKAEAKKAEAQGFDWRDVMDALRPWTVELWQGFSAADRGRFMRHMRPYWETHRHRIATPTEQGLTAYRVRAGGTGFRLGAGRVASIDWKGDNFEVEIRPRHQNTSVRFSAKWIINCTGPQGDYAKADDPLIKNAIMGGILRTDAFKLGLDVTNDGLVIGGDGTPSPNIAAIGPPTRGIFWEITAVPAIRHACAQVAETLLKS